ncbi:NAD(P)-binding domain-containing protein [Modestobacter sp. VKM Ac-2986]|uniref:flavin-containing monooxygenase n=1 Tax=Modestobacter sp. VKM Ac-2986 TaxID=3004140 RepID=UPI0022AA6098|nr:NAD(P)-binding domain-containing protein [Modestobacter sp. VKM Ac-2986]MCZ2829092.1 NAD(P)-binding domain-containing protein [Modestobacter sp. VKM Ac-2986]
MQTTVQDVDCLVIGAGPAGLAAAHELMRVGRRVLVLEQGAGVAMSWRAHRVGLRLHTVRRLSALPGMPIPRSYGRYVTSADLVRYLEHYAASSDIDIRFGTTVTHIEPAGGIAGRPWVVSTAAGTTYEATTVVMATGYNRRPFIPDLPGLDGYDRPYVHAADYRGGDQYAGLDVLVVGAGNAAAEAATDLVAAGAGRVSLAVRTTPHIVRRRVWGISMQAIAILMSPLPVSVADRLASVLSRLTIPDLSARKVARPQPDLYTRVRRDRSVPVHDTGIVRLIESGAVVTLPAVTGFGADTVHLADGSTTRPDVVVFATGYRRGLETLLDGLGLLDEQGTPTSSGTEAAPGLYFVGFTVSATGALRELAGDAQRVADHERRRPHRDLALAGQ